MVHNDIPDERNIRYAEQNWDSALAFTGGSNTHTLFKALLSSYNSVDDDIESLYEQTHINSATGAELDQFGELVNVERKSNESDAKYRARIKATFRASTMGATFDQYVEFCTSVLQTDVANLNFNTPYESQPATVIVGADGDVYNSVGFTAEEIVSLLEKGVPAGHRVEVVEGGTLQLKEDGEGDDPTKGLTADDIDEGGTLSEDILE